MTNPEAPTSPRPGFVRALAERATRVSRSGVRRLNQIVDTCALDAVAAARGFARGAGAAQAVGLNTTGVITAGTITAITAVIARRRSVATETESRAAAGRSL